MTVKLFGETSDGGIYALRYQHEPVYHLRRNGDYYATTLCGVGNFTQMSLDDTENKPLCAECELWYVVRMME